MKRPLDLQLIAVPQWLAVPDEKLFETLRHRLDPSRGGLEFPFLRSAVIVPLLEGAEGMEIVFELRARNLRRSPGEVCFPGGRVEAGESPWQAALRELEEELGVAADKVECLGQLPEQQRRREELIVPFVGRLSPDVRLRPDGREVEEVFSLPLQRILDSGFNRAQLVERYTLSDDFPHHYLPSGRWDRQLSRGVPYQVHGKYLIWGLSAGILLQLVELIR